VPRCAAASNTKRARVTQTARATRFPASYLGLGGVLQELHLHRLQLLLVRSELSPLRIHGSSSDKAWRVRAGAGAELLM